MDGSSARFALRMRVNRSEMGSFIILPASLRDPRNQSVQGSLAKREAGAPELAQISVAAAAHRTAINHPDGAGIARQLREAGVIALRLQLGANGGVFLNR